MMYSESWEQVTCGSCGETGLCTPWSDYYETPLFDGDGRVCEQCFQRLVVQYMQGRAAVKE